MAKIASLITASILPIMLATSANAAAFQNTFVQTDGVVELIAANQSGKKQLERLLKPHFSRFGNPITQKVKNATGDPNIVVFDRRGGGDSVFRCSFITYKGKRAMTCD